MNVFSLSPTFTQGLLLGQLSILIILALVLKYLFLLPQNDESETPIFHPLTKPENLSRARSLPSEVDAFSRDAESANWFNLLARQTADVYRAKLQDELQGSEGNETARARIEEYANKIRPRDFLDHITIHAVDLGNSAPLLSDAQLVDGADENALTSVRFHVSYTDSVSISLSTAYLFNYPMSSFARLPVSLTISLDLFQSSVTVTPPSLFSPEPVLTISLPPGFTLDLKTTSLMGSRAMLKDVPKLHELIEHQVRRVLASRGTWKVPLPGLEKLAGDAEKREQDGDSVS
ncbi:maintenance of mitochondrial morphology protein 1 [Chiua virens]|nr:maintenance of mitochondrial morphology protein 1 [Chiua virens]